MFPHLKYSEEEIISFIDAADEKTIEKVLKKNERRNFHDLLTLFSPLAVNYFEPMREIAARNRIRHYGKVVRLYAPLYISNFCINSCKYCDFNCHNKSERTRLTFDDIIAEAEAIKELGIDSLLLVAGEDPRNVTVEFLEKLTCELRKKFSYLAIEIAPQDTADYARLAAAGIDGLTLYQETYNRELYKELHPSGPKRDFDYRVEALARGGEAGFRNLGIGFLLGLYPWRSEAANMAAQAIYLRKHYWKSHIQFSFPRITPIEGQFDVPAPVSDTELEQMMLAFRVVFPEADMTISTRENAAFRNKMVQCCAGNMSAGSRVTPGGYKAKADEDVGQFTLNDSRSVDEVFHDMKKMGFEPVFKFWDDGLKECDAV